MDNDPVDRQQLPGAIRALLVLALIAFVAIQLWLQLKPGGALELHGFWGGFDAFFQKSLEDPIMTAGLVDILTTLVVLYIILLNGIPRGPMKPVIVILGILAGFVYPGLLGLVFLLLFWKRRNQFVP